MKKLGRKVESPFCVSDRTPLTRERKKILGLTRRLLRPLKYSPVDSFFFPLGGIPLARFSPSPMDDFLRPPNNHRISKLIPNPGTQLPTRIWRQVTQARKIPLRNGPNASPILAAEAFQPMA